MDFEVSLIEAMDRGAGWMSFRFERPGGYSFEAGQFALWSIGEGLRKPFSFSSSPTEEGILEFTTKMSGSDFKRKLASLKAGDRIRVSPPMGKFTYRGQRGIACLAGGVGITPFRSIIKFLSDTKADCDVVLIWGIMSLEEAVFMDVFESMKTENPKLKTLYVPTNPPSGWALRSGFIDMACIAGEVPDYPSRAFYVCGPPKMVEAMRRCLSELGIPQDGVVVEEFGGD